MFNFLNMPSLSPPSLSSQLHVSHQQGPGASARLVLVPFQSLFNLQNQTRTNLLFHNLLSTIADYARLQLLLLTLQSFHWHPNAASNVDCLCLD